MSSWAPRRVSRFSLRSILWTVVFAVLFLSYVLYSPRASRNGAVPGPMDWAFQSWPAPFAMAVAIWLLLQGRLATTPTFVQRCCRFIIVFLSYVGFLYLLKWNPIWGGVQSLGFKHRDTAEGCLILVSTLAWLVASVRVLFPGSLLYASRRRSDGPETRNTRTKRSKPWLTLTDIAIYNYLVNRK